jgi:hypothetical protein
MVCALVVIAIVTHDDERRKTAVDLLKIIKGPVISIGKPSGGGS